MISITQSPFVVFDCNLVQRATGESVSNLRELRRAVQEMDALVLRHHMLHCKLGDRFELDEFPNDFARWCWEDLGDRITGERLGLIDPYRHATLDELRAEIVDALEERLWVAEGAPNSCRPGLELHLIGSQLLAYQTEMQFDSITALAEAIPRMSLRSLYYHVHDARRRTGGETDDFSAWFESVGADPDMIRRVREIDFYFLGLGQLRETLLSVFQQHFPAHRISTGAGAVA